MLIIESKYYLKVCNYITFDQPCSLFQGSKLNSLDTKYDIVSSEDGPRLRNKLIIKQLDDDDFGSYEVNSNLNL